VDMLDYTHWQIWGAATALLLLAIFWILLRRRRAGEAQAREFEGYREAVKALLAEDLDAAIAALRTAAEANSGRVSTYLALGRIFRRKGEPDRALRVHRSLSVRQGLPAANRLEALREAALDELAANRPQQALSLLDEVLAKQRKDRESLEAAARAHVRLEHWEAAYDLHRRIDRLTKRPRSDLLARLLAARARQLLMEGDPGAARKILKKALGLHAESVDALMVLGDVHLAEGKAGRAIESWEKILDLEPRWVAVLASRLEQAFFHLGDVDRLEGLLRRLTSRRPRDPVPHLVLARHLVKKQRADDALGALKTAIDLDPSGIAARRERGRIQLEHGFGVSYESEFADLLKALPEDPPPLRCTRCGAPSGEPALLCEACGAWDTVRLDAPAPEST
jgi:lipopolysaccharide biosynthesis regulator YciM